VQPALLARTAAPAPRPAKVRPATNAAVLRTADTHVQQPIFRVCSRFRLRGQHVQRCRRRQLHGVPGQQRNGQWRVHHQVGLPVLARLLGSEWRPLHRYSSHPVLLDDKFQSGSLTSVWHPAPPGVYRQSARPIRTRRVRATARASSAPRMGRPRRARPRARATPATLAPRQLGRAPVRTRAERTYTNLFSSLLILRCVLCMRRLSVQCVCPDGTRRLARPRALVRRFAHFALPVWLAFLLISLPVVWFHCTADRVPGEHVLGHQRQHVVHELPRQLAGAGWLHKRHRLPVQDRLHRPERRPLLRYALQSTLVDALPCTLIAMATSLMTANSDAACPSGTIKTVVGPAPCVGTRVRPKTATLMHGLTQLVATNIIRSHGRVQRAAMRATQI